MISFSFQRLARRAFFLSLISFPIQLMVIVAYPDLSPLVRIFDYLLGLTFFLPGLYNWLRGRSNEDDRALFLSELSLLTARELPLDQALEALARSRRRQMAFRFAAFTPVITELAKRVSKGAALSHALRGIREVPKAWVEMLDEAEGRDALPAALAGLAAIERTRLRLPILTVLRTQFLLVMLLGVVFFLGEHILPPLIEINETTGVQMRWATRVIAQAKESALLPLLILPISLMVSLLFLSIPFPSLQNVLRWFAFYLPGFRGVLKAEQQSRAVTAIATAARLGLPLPSVLAAGRAAVNFRPYRKALTGKDGSNLSEILESRPRLFSPSLAWLCRQGEAFDRLPEALEAAVESLERQYRQRSHALIVGLDTVLLIAMGVAVGIVTVGATVPYHQYINALLNGVLP